MNIGRAEIDGAESFASFDVTPAFRVRADYTYTLARDALTGEELLRRPRNKVSVTSSWKATDALTLTATANFLSSWRDDFLGSNYVPGYRSPGFTTVNIAATYAATDRITLFGRIDNVFDAKYENPAGYLRPGIGVFGGAKIAVDVQQSIDAVK